MKPHPVGFSFVSVGTASKAHLDRLRSKAPHNAPQYKSEEEDFSLSDQQFDEALLRSAEIKRSSSLLGRGQQSGLQPHQESSLFMQSPAALAASAVQNDTSASHLQSWPAATASKSSSKNAPSQHELAPTTATEGLKKTAARQSNNAPKRNKSKSTEEPSKQTAKRPRFRKANELAFNDDHESSSESDDAEMSDDEAEGDDGAGITPKISLMSAIHQVLQYSYGKLFYKRHYPPWFEEEVTGRPRKLDFYNDEENLAVDVHREHNSKDDSSGVDVAEETLKIEHEKAVKCKEQGVDLLILPSKLRLQDIQRSLLAELQKANRPPPSNTADIDITTLLPDKQHLLKQCQDCAQARGGRCLAVLEDFAHSKNKVPFVCARGHPFTTRAENVIGGSWCQTCFLKGKRYDIKVIKAKAQQKGGICLTDVYDPDKQLEMQCSAGHKFFICAFKFMRKNQWCTQCLHNSLRDDIEVLRQIAVSRGGQLVSTVYVNQYKPLRWQCSCGNVWNAPARAVKQEGQWCRRCAVRKRAAGQKGKRQDLASRVAHMRQVAREHNSECISDTTQRFRNSDELQWRCLVCFTIFTHNFFALQKRKSLWCPHCRERGTEQ